MKSLVRGTIAGRVRADSNEMESIHMKRYLVWFLARLPLIALMSIVLLVMSNCTMLGLNYASLEVDNKPAPYPSINVNALISDRTTRHEIMSPV